RRSATGRTPEASSTWSALRRASRPKPSKEASAAPSGCWPRPSPVMVASFLKIHQRCHPDRSATKSLVLSEVYGAEWRNAERVSLTMLTQGVLPVNCPGHRSLDDTEVYQRRIRATPPRSFV